jgi:hypothetical protein
MSREARLLVRLLLAALFAVLVLAGGAAAASASTFTWSGTDASNAGWTVGDNWLGGVAPSASDSGDSLVFPGGLTGGDCETTQYDACYESANDLSGYDVDQLRIDDGAGYDIGGADALTIGAGGIGAITGSSTFNPSVIDIPIALGAGQTWGIDGGPGGEGELNVDGGVAGTSDALNVLVSDEGFLDLDLGSSNEVGDVSIAGSNSGFSGLDAYYNGALELSAESDLNGGDSNSIQLAHAAIVGDGTLGPVTSIGGVISAGDPLGNLAVNGTVTLDSASVLQFGIADGGTIPGTDYSQLSTTGNVSLDGAELDISGTDGNNDCPVLSPLTSDTLVTTTGTISGTFANVANGGVLTLDCASASPPQVTITYTPHSITATPPAISTTTTLSYLPNAVLPYAGATVTLTASVSPSKGAAYGSVLFTSHGNAIPGCTAQTLTPAGKFWNAVCTTTYGAAGSAPDLVATFEPSPGTVDQASSSLPLYADVQVRADEPDESDLKASASVASGDAASLAVTCTVAQTFYGPPDCEGGAQLTTSRSVTVTRHGKRRHAHRLVIVGSAAFTVSQVSATELVTLNAAGRRR